MHTNREDVSIMNPFVAIHDPNTKTFASLRVDSMKLPNSAGVAQPEPYLYCRLDDRDSVPDTCKDFLLLTPVHTGYSTFKASNQTDVSRSTTTLTAPNPARRSL
jgi:hypothetical protein